MCICLNLHELHTNEGTWCDEDEEILIIIKEDQFFDERVRKPETNKFSLKNQQIRN